MSSLFHGHASQDLLPLLCTGKGLCLSLAFSEVQLQQRGVKNNSVLRDKEGDVGGRGEKKVCSLRAFKSLNAPSESLTHLAKNVSDNSEREREVSCIVF